MRHIRLITCIHIFALLFCTTPSYASIIVSEFAIDTPQKVEVSNTGPAVVDISGWYIDDDGGSSAYFTIPINTSISPNQCIVFSGTFNLNTASTDQIRLFDQSAPPSAVGAQLVDSHSYTGSPGTGKSYSRNPHTSSTWVAQTTSFGLFNDSLADCSTVSISPTPTATPTDVQILSPTPSYSPTPLPTSTPTPTVIPIPKVYLSEVYANPTDDQDEWIELYNDSEYVVDLQGWFVDDIEGGGSSPVALTGSISPKQLYVVVMTKTIFNNTNDSVRLITNQANVLEVFMYDHTDVAMSWAKPYPESTYFCTQSPTRGQQNHACSTTDGTTSTQAAQVTPSAIPTPTPTIDMPDQIFLSEIFPQPSSDDSEWVELFNDSDSTAYLRDWYIDDISNGGAAPRIFSMNIASKSFGVIEFSQQLMNNDGDTIQLLDPRKTLVETFTYTSSDEGLSIAKSSLEGSSWCFQVPTRNGPNTSCIAPSPTPTHRPTTTPKPTVTPRVAVSKSNSDSSVLGKTTSSTSSGSTRQSSSRTPVEEIAFDDRKSVTEFDDIPEPGAETQPISTLAKGPKTTIIDTLQVILGMIMGTAIWQIMKRPPS